MNDSFEKHDPSDPIHDQMVGKLALSYKLVTPGQYLEALTIQKREGSSHGQVLLGDVLFSHGFLSSEQVGLLHQAIDIMTMRRKDKRFGSIAVNRGFIRREELNKALVLQKKEKKEIGQILIDLGYLTKGEMQEILDIQKNTRITVPKLEEISNLPTQKNQLNSNSGDTLVLNISQDALSAVVVLPENRKDISPEDIQAFLDSKGVTFGKMPPEYIQACLDSRELGVTAFVVARGQKGQSPASGPVTIHFSLRPLEHDNQFSPTLVKDGDILAERELTRKGVPRITVFGVGFDEKEANETVFMNGCGARVNPDRNQITAACDGEPFLFTDGAVGVLKVHQMESSGTSAVTLSFDGHVEIKGIVGLGSDIRCVHVSAGQIESASIWAEGDVRVEGQLTDSTVIAAGTVQADMIRNCTISSIGDVVAVNDILDSTIETSCRCIAGKSVISSTIKARRGLVAEDVVSSDGAPTRIEFGVNVIPAILSGDHSKIKDLESEIGAVVDQIHAKESLIRIADQAVGDIAVNLKKNESEQMLLESTVSRMEQKSNRQIMTGRNKLLDLKEEIQAAKDIMNVLADDRLEIEKQMNSLKKQLQIKMKIYREQRGNTEQKSSQMMKRLSGLPCLAHIEIKNEIDRGTFLQGPHGSRILEKTLKKTTISEQKNQDGTYIIHISAEGS